MNWLIYSLIFLAVCAVWFVVTRIWVGGIDLVVSVFRKMLGLNQKESTGNWHTLEDIREKNKSN